MERRLGEYMCVVLALIVITPALAQQDSEDTGGAEKPQAREGSRLAVVRLARENEQESSEGQSRLRPLNVSSASSKVPGPRSLVGGVHGGDGAPARRSFLRFGFSLSQRFDNSVFQSAQRKGESAVSQLRPSIVFMRTGRGTYTGIDYRGDAQVYAEDSDLNSFGHEILARHHFLGNRWSLDLSHQLRYTPDPLLTGSIADEGQERDNLLGAEDTLVAPRVDRLFNTSAVAIAYRASRRSSLSWAAAYRDVRDLGGVFVDYSEISLRTAYNRTYSRHGTFSLFPDVRLVRSSRELGGSESYAISVGHSYQAGERWWWSLNGGPQYTQFEQSTGAGLPQLESRSVIGWTGGSNLTYNRARSAFGLFYRRQVSGSGGVAGSVRNQTFGTKLSMHLFGRWSSQLTANYSENRGLDPTRSSHESVNAGLHLQRPIGAASFFIRYNFWRQLSDFPGLSFTRNVFTVGFFWSSRPILLRR